MIGLNCREVARRIASDEWHTAAWRERALLRLHLFMCARCRRYKSQLEMIGKAMKDLWRETEDPATLDRLRRKILDR